MRRVIGILKMVVEYGLPLMKKGAETTSNPIDNYIVAFLEGGLPKVVEVMEKLEGESQTQGK